MNTPNKQQASDEFVSRMKVVHRSTEHRRTGRKPARILSGNQICMDSHSVKVGEPRQTIQIVPIMENGRIKALKASCSCGSESIYDIQYTETEENNS